MESYELIDQLRELEPVDMVCKAFSVPRASYYDYCQQKRHINVQRFELKALFGPLTKAEVPLAVE